jgi:YegS/Rv2252/BmrU family lipid kinase
MYSSTPMRISLVVNPRSGSGRGARQLATLRRRLEAAGQPHDIFETSRRGEATELARRAIDAGADVLGVLGGDGTLNEVSQAYIDTEGRPRPGPPIALIPSGTGGDFPKSCGFVGSGLDAAVERLCRARTRPLDLGVVTLTDASGHPLHRAFVNIASVGISGDVDERVERGPKWLGGKAAFLLGTVTAALGYRNVPIEIDVDGAPWQRGPTLITAIANGRYLGGGMHIAPRAEIADGWLDVVSVGDLSRATFLRLFPSVYKGAHLELESVRSTRGRLVEVRPQHSGQRSQRGASGVLVDVDGETPGYLPLSARIFPNALQLVGD